MIFIVNKNYASANKYKLHDLKFNCDKIKSLINEEKSSNNFKLILYIIIIWKSNP